MNFLNELFFDFFGIELLKVVEIIVNVLVWVGVFIFIFLELFRNYVFKEENFYFGALCVYLELYNNYFEDLEEEVGCFIKFYEIFEACFILEVMLC